MNVCTETAPDIRVAGPAARDFLVRAFALFRVTGATGRRSAGRTGATGVDTVWFFVRQARGGGEGAPFVSGAPTVNPVPVSVHGALPARYAKTRSTTPEFHVDAALHLVTDLSIPVPTRLI